MAPHTTRTSEVRVTRVVQIIFMIIKQLYLLLCEYESYTLTLVLLSLQFEFKF